MTTTIRQSKFDIKPVKPVYGVNYYKGYIGFTYNSKSPIGQGIAYFTKWAKMSNIYATHALIVKDETLCIEADAFKNCVTERPLKDYFNDEKCQIFFRKPKDLTDEIADRIVKFAQQKVGEQYNFELILTQALSGTFAGHFFDNLLQGKLEKDLTELLDDPNKWICSELAAYTLDEQPQYRDQGILKHPNATISPQELFEDLVIFEPWKNRVAEKCSDG